MKKLTLRQMAVIGLMAALVFVTSGIRITIPLPVDKAAVHMGNVMCVLSGLILGPIGGLASGFGSFFYDLANPLYAPEALITLFNKFFIGFLAGLIAHSGGRAGRSRGRNLLAGVAGSAAYVCLYLLKSWWFGVYVYLLAPGPAFWTYVAPKLVTSLFNGAVAVVVAVPLATAVQSALDKNRTSTGG